MTPTELYAEVSKEIARGNYKHGHAPLATYVEVVSILTEELGEFAGEINKGNKLESRKELIQLVAVAVNYLLGTGPHFSNL